MSINPGILQMKKYCQRCHAAFDFDDNTIADLQNPVATIIPATREFLINTQYQYLCNGCLIEIDQMVQQSQKQVFPDHPQMLKEGLHFYKQNGNLIFTEFYLLSKGYCCGNGCRHCAYGFNKQQ